MACFMITPAAPAADAAGAAGGKDKVHNLTWGFRPRLLYDARFAGWEENQLAPECKQ